MALTNQLLFPAPREVDRELYCTFNPNNGLHGFSAPREVDRGLYTLLTAVGYFYKKKLFPAPLKVDRKLYKAKNFTPSGDVIGFRPLAR